MYFPVFHWRISSCVCCLTIEE